MEKIEPVRHEKMAFYMGFAWFVWGIMVLMAWGSMARHMLGGPISLWPIFLMASVPVGCWVFFRLRRFFSPWRGNSFWGRASTLFTFWLIVVTWSAGFMPALGWANQLLDFAPNAVVTVQVDHVMKHRSKGNYFYRAWIKGWPTQDSVMPLGLNTTDENDFHACDRLELTVGDGLFGIPYIKDYRKIG